MPRASSANARLRDEGMVGLLIAPDIALAEDENLVRRAGNAGFATSWP